MKERFVGFYWTLPVRWAGFTQLASDAKTAAAESTTIRYQRALVHEYVAKNGDALVGEIAALETSPDRATEYMKSEIAKAKSLCAQKGAKLLWVDFGSCNWRPHRFIQEAVYEDNLPNLALEAEPVTMQGKWFDPRDHFRTWRDSEEEERAHRKPFVMKEFEKALAAEPDMRGRYGRIAERLNAAGVPTLGGGKEWKADNVKKVAAGYFRDGSIRQETREDDRGDILPAETLRASEEKELCRCGEDRTRRIVLVTSEQIEANGQFKAWGIRNE